MCNCHETKKCCKKRCVKKYVIKSLPYTIDKPGHYCLCKDFTWTLSETDNGISIKNTENVVLDFNQKKITVVKPDPIPDPELYLPTVLVQNTLDVVLENVHLEASGAAEHVATGLHIKDSGVVEVNSLLTINMGEFIRNAALLASNSSEIVVSKARLDNFGSPLFHYGVVFDNVLGFSFTDAETLGNVLFFKNSKNGEILRCRVDNFNAQNLNRGIIIEGDNGQYSANIRIAECEVLVKDWYGIWVATFGFDPAAPEYNRDILIENNIITGADGDTEFGPSTIQFQRVKDCVVRNNTISVELTDAWGILTIDAINCTFEGNNVVCNKGAEVGIAILQVSEPSYGNLIRGNHVSAELDYTDPETPASKSFEGIVVGSFVTDVLPASYNTVDRNVVNGFLVGYADAFLGKKSKCSIFSNNIANGNGTNYDFTVVDTTDVNNISGCVLPPPPAPASLSKLSERLKVKIGERRERK